MRKKAGRARRILQWLLAAVAAFYGLVVLGLLFVKVFFPPTTAVQVERRVQSWSGRPPYHKAYVPVAFVRISPNLQHAVIAAEDARFYLHSGFDWKQLESAVQEDIEGGRSRGASTITQQLVKNLFLTTSHSFVRKGIEFTIVPFAERILGKRRILELYLNVIEWGPGIYGAQAAAKHWYGKDAAELSREESIQLAAMLPDPRHRKPGRTQNYSERIAAHMRQMGW